MPPLNLTITDTSVVLEGELDMATVPLLGDALAALVGTSSQPMVLDLAGLSFVDAAGLRALASGRDLFALEHRSLTLVNPPEMLRRIATLTGMSGRLGWD